VIDHAQFFRRLGKRVRELRRKRGHSQEDMISFGFSARQALDVRLTAIVAGLDRWS
jgi:hypothetical protein